MIEYTKVVLQKYVVFTGRARRAEYWYFVLALAVFSFIMNFVLLMVGSEALADTMTLILKHAIIVPSIAVGIRRMHDVDKSGWFILVPFYNLYLFIQPGTVGPNRFGQDPKADGQISEVPVPMPVPPPPPTS